MFETNQVGDARSDARSGASRAATFKRREVRWATDGWAAVAPGYGGWHVAFEDWGRGRQLAVYPPTVFHTHRTGLGFVVSAEPDGIVVEGQGDWGDLWHLATFPTLREALLHLCPLTPEQLVMADVLGTATSAPRRGRRRSAPTRPILADMFAEDQAVLSS